MIIDGYIDEPAALGVRPFIHPMVRATYGAALDAGAEAEYVTIDHLRAGAELPQADISVVLAGCAVPGRYLRSMPASSREIVAVSARLPGFRVIGGPAAASDLGGFELRASKDPPAAVFDLLTLDRPGDRVRTLKEWNRWMIKGAGVVVEHPDHPEPLVAEVETYRGCHRYRSGGCSFCVEPLKGAPMVREVEDIVAEAEALIGVGVRHLRLGGQTCFVSYAARTTADGAVPNPEAVERLLSSIARLGPDTLHLDNANPAVMADHPDETIRVLRSIVRHCTSGNVLALGMESADPRVIEENNLNSTPEQVMAAIAMMNEVGRDRGETGLPRLLPGLNFIVGLDGESQRTLELNLEFLREVRRRGYLLRRTNIRQVAPLRRGFRMNVTRGQFLRFKESVREEIDRPMLKLIAPEGQVLRRVYTELREGGRTFGRQIGTYPLLVGFNYPLELEMYVDAKVVGWGRRSVTAVEYPLDVNRCPLDALESLPGVGRKRASRIVRGRPIGGFEGLLGALDDPAIAHRIRPFLDI